MGCISSKVLSRSRSLSFQEERNQSLQGKKSNGMPLLEELFTSASCNRGSDQFITLVCTATTKLRNGAFTLPSDSNTTPKSPTTEPTNTNTINTWELMAGLKEEEQVVTTSSSTLDFNKARRSKSCQLSPTENEVLSAPVPGIGEGLNEGEFNKGIVRSRSFHTVEEYDAMLEQIWAHKTLVDDADIVDTKEVLPSLKSSSLIAQHYSSNLKHDDVEERRSKCEKGLKRKAMAKGLESLKIPPTIEFPRVTSLRKCVHVEGRGQLYSPGAYVTPKFGSYNLPNHGTQKKCSVEESIFNPELVAAFEESMQQLQVEEESLLKQIEGKHNS